MEIFPEDIAIATSIGERVRTIRRSQKMTQKEFSASLGIVQGFLCSIERGKKHPSDTLLIALQHLYGIQPEWLKNGSGTMLLQGNAVASSAASPAIPLYASSPPSIDRLSAVSVKNIISLPDVPADCFAFEYSGEFMNPTIRDGDIVIIKPGQQPVSGEIILIVSKWGDAILRRYRRRGDEIYCSADNSSYSAFRADANTKILGVVQAVWRNIKI